MKWNYNIYKRIYNIRGRKRWTGPIQAREEERLWMDENVRRRGVIWIIQMQKNKKKGIVKMSVSYMGESPSQSILVELPKKKKKKGKTLQQKVCATLKDLRHLSLLFDIVIINISCALFSLYIFFSFCLSLPGMYWLLNRRIIIFFFFLKFKISWFDNLSIQNTFLVRSIDTFTFDHSVQI